MFSTLLGFLSKPLNFMPLATPTQHNGILRSNVTRKLRHTVWKLIAMAFVDGCHLFIG